MPAGVTRWLGLGEVPLERRLWIVQVALAATVLGTLFVLYSQMNGNVETAKAELSGVEIHRTLRTMLHHVLLHRRAANAVRSTDTGSGHQAMETARLGIEAAEKSVDSFHSREGDALKTVVPWSGIRSSWEALKASGQSSSNEDNLAAHDRLAEALLEMMDTVGHESRLVLDPEFASFYLTYAAVILEPRSTVEFAQISLLASRVMDRTITPDESRQLDDLLDVARVRNADLHRALARVRETGRVLDVALDPLSSGARFAAADFLLASDAIANRGVFGTVDVREYPEVGDRAIKARFKLYEALGSSLDGLLRTRLDNLRLDLARTVGGVALVLVLSSLLMVTMLRDIRGINAKLEARIRERTAALESNISQLNLALQSLKELQKSLVRSEKLAALGSLVAGVAHELNTPIGNALTVASTLNEKSEQFGRDFQSGGIRRSRLEAFAVDNVEGSRLIVRNLSRAADLISSFKQVAVDQASERRRPFDLKTAIEEILSTLTPLVKRSPIRVRTELEEGVTIESYPGPLGQVITILFTNAIEHAFDGREGGEIVIEAKRSGEDSAVVRFRDDGNGIGAENLKRIFDPFFTTRLGRGGSGLGLHIAHNIVTGILAGRIDAHSEPGRGATFTVEIPRVVTTAGPDSAPFQK